jgi:hypothetical protein
MQVHHAGRGAASEILSTVPNAALAHDEEHEASAISRLVRATVRTAAVEWSLEDDLCQDVLFWLYSRKGRLEWPPPAGLVCGVVKQFLRPKNLWKMRGVRLERGSEVRTRGCGADTFADLFGRELLDSFRGQEGLIARWLLRGFSWSEACDLARVPRGSRTYHRARMRSQLGSMV